MQVLQCHVHIIGILQTSLTHLCQTQHSFQAMSSMSMIIFFTGTQLLTIVILRRHYWSTACKRSSLTRRSRSSAPSFSVRPPSHCSQGDSYTCSFREASCNLLTLASPMHCNAPLGRIIAAHPDNARIKSLIGKIISNFSLHQPMHQVRPQTNLLPNFEIFFYQ